MAYSTITKPTDYFNTVLWSGDNSARSITGVGHAPDWVWIKDRTGTNNHALFDSVRGVNKYLSTGGTAAELDQPSSGYVSSFDSDGFSGVTGSSSYANWNASGNNYVGWNWKAGGTASSNTDGSITSSVSANTTSGFSIVSYTGSGSSPSTVGHGLGEVPKMIILKNRDSASAGWQVYFHTLGNANKLELQSTNGSAATSNWNSTSPTSSVFTVNGTASGAPDASGENIIAYCFAEKKGFSKFGSYTGNGNADGTFVYTGFKPSFVIGKRTDTTGNWFVFDNKRDAENPTNLYLLPDSAAAEFTGSSASVLWDFLSNGFKIRSTGSGNNASGGTYIYMAFAENPLVSNTGGGIPATAR